MKVVLRPALIIFLLILGLVGNYNPFLQFINLIFASLLGGYIILSDFPVFKSSEKISLVLLSVLLLIYTVSTIIFSGITPDPDLLEPRDESYSIDVKDNLKTYYLMESGENYYTAYANAIIKDSRFDKPHTYHWRLPSAFYFWTTLANNGSQVRTLYSALSLLSLVSAYLLLKRYVGPTIALLSPYLLMPYFYSGFFGYSFLFIEWWGLFPFLFGLTFLSYRKHAFATVLFLISILVREHFIIPVSLILFFHFLKTKNPFHILLVFSATAAFYILHIKNLSRVIEKATQSTIPTIHGFDISLLLSTLEFSTDLYRQNFLITTIATAVLSLISIYLYKNRQKRNDNEILANYAFISIFAIYMLTPIIGTRSIEGPAYGYYWGITFVPFSILFSPLALNGKTSIITTTT